ncbi:MAG: hypothetical protein IRZ10_08865 [Thermoflavifilum sp.]|nr:hypothetical protein [Thermoflavifilum sp.]MCL6514522.1 hypothetical protein [Alicyclobacillus sp.]
MRKRYHCCATCVHFRIARQETGVRAWCARLGYDTKTFYQFNCWQPRADIVRRMEKEGERR